MGAVIVIVLLLALIFGGVGLVIEGLFWLALIAIGLVLISIILGAINRPWRRTRL